MNTIAKWLRNLGFGEKRCYICGSPYFPANANTPLATTRICSTCSRLLGPYQGPACDLCGLPQERGSPQEKHANLCQNCKDDLPPWNGRAFHGLYKGALREALLRLKFAGDINLALPLGEFLLQASRCLPKPDVIAAIPQHPAHLRKRGYNQAHELAASLGKLSGLPVSCSILKRIKHGVAQEKLTAQERKKNLENAFIASNVAMGKIIWLVDDVITTKSTCVSATQALMEAGAAETYLLFVARTPLS